MTELSHSENSAASNIEVRSLDFAYGTTQVLRDITMDVRGKGVTAFIGPSGCGKTTLLRCFNRMNDFIDSARMIGGEIKVNGVNIYSGDVELTALRRHVGMVFQKPNPFPKSIYENVVYGLRVQGIRNKSDLDKSVEECLRSTALWDDVKNRLNESALGLSGGQQQRLCIARALAVKPQILLMDEPCSALDPIATAKVEELIHSLKKDYTIVIVTHNMQQAARVSDRTAFFYLGKLIEYDVTDTIFMNPNNEQTEAYVSGRFG